MQKYRFETEQFGLSAEGIHLLRSRFNYETIPFAQIQKLRVLKGKTVNNWLILLGAGMAAFVFSIYYTLALFDFFTAGTGGVFYVEELLLPIGTMLMGGFLVYVSLSSGTIMIVLYDNKRKRLSLESLRKSGQLSGFISEMEAATSHKGKVIEIAALV